MPIKRSPGDLLRLLEKIFAKIQYKQKIKSITGKTIKIILSESFMFKLLLLICILQAYSNYKFYLQSNMSLRS